MNTPAHPKFFRPGQFLFREGEPSHAMYLVKRGTVSIRKMKGAAYVEIARVYSNEVLGELSFFDRHPRSAAAVALTEVEALEIGFDALDKIYANVPDYLKTIIAAVAERLRKANDAIRRLQRNVVAEGAEESESEPGKEEELDAAAAMEATAGMDLGEVPKPEGEGGEGNPGASGG